MQAVDSETLFAEFLNCTGATFSQHVAVWQDRNVDFRVHEPPMLCDVKEIRPRARKDATIDHGEAIRDDIKELRSKFGSSPPQIPVLLVTVNLSDMFFTGLTVAMAMLGKVGTQIGEQMRTPFAHLPRGGAAMTMLHSTAVSGVFVLDCAGSDHCLFTNPFARHAVPMLDWPHSRIELDRNASEETLTGLGARMFWPCSLNDRGHR